MNSKKKGAVQRQLNHTPRKRTQTKEFITIITQFLLEFDVVVMLSTFFGVFKPHVGVIAFLILALAVVLEAAKGENA